MSRLRLCRVGLFVFFQVSAFCFVLVQIYTVHPFLCSEAFVSLIHSKFYHTSRVYTYAFSLDNQVANPAGANFNMPRRKGPQRSEHEANMVRVTVEFEETYGRDETKLDKLQQLCRDVGVTEGRSVTQCKKVIKPACSES